MPPSMFPVTTALLLVISLMIFAHSLYQRIALLQTAQGQEKRTDQIWKRIKGVMVFAFGQTKLFKFEWLSGLAHALIFWGFCVIALRTVTLFFVGFNEEFIFWGMGGVFGRVYDVTLNIFLLLVVLGCSYGFVRRLITRPKRLTLSAEANLILFMIILLCVSDVFFEAAGYAQGKEVFSTSFLSFRLGHGLANLSLIQLRAIESSSFLVHCLLILVFLNVLPFTKHFHIITSIPNVFFRNLRPAGEIKSINLLDETATTFGVDKIEQFTWKQYLNWYSCTECGRCTAQCPAANSEKALDPKKLTIKLRNALYGLDGLNGHEEPSGEKDLLQSTVQPEELWACTTCRACEDACPVMIEHLPQILDMRRNLVLMQGSFPPELQSVFQNLERNGNPWGISFEERGAWAKELNIPLLKDKPDAEYLYFVGCAASYDEKAKKTAQAFARILQKANISFAILGPEEKCTGDSARRLGNEYLAQQLIQENVATLNRYGVKKIITTCPHCYNAIKNDFPQFGGTYEVWHHTEFLWDFCREQISLFLEQKERTDPSSQMERKYSFPTMTYHDPCYLGRYNAIYDAPRNLLKSILGNENIRSLQEADTNLDMARCCGAGGGRMWMEETAGKRINHMRLDDLMKTGAQTIVTACPFCKTMLQDALKETNMEGVDVKDVVEMLEEGIKV